MPDDRVIHPRRGTRCIKPYDHTFAEAPMNAREQREIVEALRQSGALVERGEYEGGSLQRWVEIPWEAVLGRLSQFGWKVSLKPKDAPPLTLESS